jgi:PKD repeat protein
MFDTVFLEDHSMINHNGASWHWEISPEPEYISDPNTRNPKVVLGNPGTYSITMTLSKGGQEYSKEIIDYITTTSCPSIEDCNNPDNVPKDIWELVYVDSEEVNYPGLATMAFDDDPSTIWHTRWSTGNDPYPHEIIVDMGTTYQLFNFTLLNRQDGENGRIQDYMFYVSEDNENWVLKGMGDFENTAAPQTLEFEESANGRYFKLVGISEVNGNAWASAAEFDLMGCTDLVRTQQLAHSFDLKAYPQPVNSTLTIELPDKSIDSYDVLNASGMLLSSSQIITNTGKLTLNLDDLPAGLYILRFKGAAGIQYRVKVLKD